MTTTTARSLAQEFRRPRSLLQLVLAIAVALLFAGLGQWQLQRAVQNGVTEDRPTETVRSLESVGRPGAGAGAAVGQRVSASGRWAPGDFRVVEDRVDRGRTGAWVTGHALLDDPAGASLAVALGWAPDARRAADVVARLNAGPPGAPTIVGRYLDADEAVLPETGAPERLTRMSVAQLVNEWRAPAGAVYGGYVTLRAAPAGLIPIDSPPPSQQVELNLLNLLYAGEWVVFAGIAIYIWYRLVRDRWEARRPAEERQEPGSGTAVRHSRADGRRPSRS